jgi:hypothetical protein
MGDANKYRANACHCQRMADKALSPEDKLNWLNVAETWLGMIPDQQRTLEEMYNQGVGQEPWKSGNVA